MAKIPAPYGVPLKEDTNYNQGKSGAGTPITMGPAVGRTSGNATSSGGINRGTKPFNTSMKSGTRHA